MVPRLATITAFENHPENCFKYWDQNAGTWRFRFNWSGVILGHTFFLFFFLRLPRVSEVQPPVKNYQYKAGLSILEADRLKQRMLNDCLKALNWKYKSYPRISSKFTESLLQTHAVWLHCFTPIWLQSKWGEIEDHGMRSGSKLAISLIWGHSWG